MYRLCALPLVYTVNLRMINSYLRFGMSMSFRCENIAEHVPARTLTSA
jgi:hypothetical protein